MDASKDPPYLAQGCVTPYPKGEVVARLAWGFIQATLFRWSPRPCHRWRAWLLRGFGANIPQPAQVVIFPTVRITFPWRLRLEPRSMLGPNVTVYNLGPISLLRGANVSQNCHLCSGSHDFRRWSMPLTTAPIEIGENAWLGADSFVGSGVKIGELCVVGARSVVVSDLPPSTICVGHPCRPIKPRPHPTP